MSGMEEGWHAHPDAIERLADLGPVEPGRVVGLGALCDLGPRRFDDARSQSFSVSVQAHESLESITHEVLNVVLPDDDESGADHPWPWLAELARARGLQVTAEDLRGWRPGDPHRHGDRMAWGCLKLTHHRPRLPRRACVPSAMLARSGIRSPESGIQGPIPCTATP